MRAGTGANLRTGYCARPANERRRAGAAVLDAPGEDRPHRRAGLLGAASSVGCSGVLFAIPAARPPTRSSADIWLSRSPMGLQRGTICGCLSVRQQTNPAVGLLRVRLAGHPGCSPNAVRYFQRCSSRRPDLCSAGRRVREAVTEPKQYRGRRANFASAP